VDAQWDVACHEILGRKYLSLWHVARIDGHCWLWCDHRSVVEGDSQVVIEGESGGKR